MSSTTVFMSAMLKLATPMARVRPSSLSFISVSNIAAGSFYGAGQCTR